MAFWIILAAAMLAMVTFVAFAPASAQPDAPGCVSSFRDGTVTCYTIIGCGEPAISCVVVTK